MISAFPKHKGTIYNRKVFFQQELLKDLFPKPKNLCYTFRVDTKDPNMISKFINLIIIFSLLFLAVIR
jgi:hypothetical protein